MTNIKLKCKLSAYTKGIIPTRTSELINDAEFINEAPDDGKLYGKKSGNWVVIDDEIDKVRIITDHNAGISLEQVELDTYKIGVRKWEGYEQDLPENLDPNCTYYVIDNKPQTFITAGTAFSDENEESFVVISGGGENGVGGAKITKFDYEIKPLNAWGEYNE